MQVGLVGAPNSGKSTFLKACSLSDVEIQSYPFTTIEANRGVGYVTAKCPCQDMETSCNPQNSKCMNGTRLIPVKLLDVAGLVPDAHEGKGLGNQFLDDLREADALIHVLDISGRTNAEGEPTEEYNPIQNINFLERELDFWFKDIFMREWEKLSSEIETQNLDFEERLLSRFSGLKISKEDISEGIRELDLDPDEPSKWEERDIKEFASLLRKKTKPMIIAANKIDLPESQENLKEVKKKTSMDVVPSCAEAELALREASDKNLIKYIPGSSDFEIKNKEKISEKQTEALKFVKKILNEFGSTGIQECLNKSVFELLDMIVVYPVEDKNKLTDKRGNVLPDAILLKNGSTAEDLAFEVHSDIGEEFIGAIDCKTGRKIGAEHKLQDGDIIKILTS